MDENAIIVKANKVNTISVILYLDDYTKMCIPY